MFFKRLDGSGYASFIAVTKFQFDHVASENLLYGNRIYNLNLSDGSIEKAYLESKIWLCMEKGMVEGGPVINA